MDLHLRDLRFFETVAELGHLGQAAEQVGRSQPALTKCIQRLEHVIGSPLFERAGRGIRLTPVGEVRDFAQGSAGQVALGSGPIAAEHMVPELCRAVLADMPRVKMDVMVGPSFELRSLLRQGKLDLLVGLAVDSDPELVSHPLVEDVVVVAADRKHPVFDRARVTMPALLEYGWALPSAHIPSRQWLDLAFGGRGLPAPDVKLESGSIALLPRMVERSQLLTFVSRHTLSLDRGASLREVKLQATTLRRSLGVTHRRAGYLSPATQRVLKLLKQRGKSFFSP